MQKNSSISRSGAMVRPIAKGATGPFRSIRRPSQARAPAFETKNENTTALGGVFIFGGEHGTRTHGAFSALLAFQASSLATRSTLHGHCAAVLSRPAKSLLDA